MEPCHHRLFQVQLLRDLLAIRVCERGRIDQRPIPWRHAACLVVCPAPTRLAPQAAQHAAPRAAPHAAQHAADGSITCFLLMLTIALRCRSLEGKKKSLQKAIKDKIDSCAATIPIYSLGGGEIEPPPPNADEADGLEKLWEFIEVQQDRCRVTQLHVTLLSLPWFFGSLLIARMLARMLAVR